MEKNIGESYFLYDFNNFKTDTNLQIYNFSTTPKTGG